MDFVHTLLPFFLGFFATAVPEGGGGSGEAVEGAEAGEGDTKEDKDLCFFRAEPLSSEEEEVEEGGSSSATAKATECRGVWRVEEWTMSGLGPEASTSTGCGGERRPTGGRWMDSGNRGEGMRLRGEPRRWSSASSPLEEDW